MKLPSHRMTSPHAIKEEHMTSQADSTEDIAPPHDTSDPSDALVTSQQTPSCHQMGGVKRMTSQDISPIPSPTQCQYDATMTPKPTSGGYSSMTCMSGPASDSVYYPHHPARLPTGSAPFLPAATSSPLLPSMNHGLGFSSQMAACRLASQSPSDCALRGASSSSTSPTSSTSAAAAAAAATSPYANLRPSPTQLSQHPHNPFSSCTYMQPSQPGYPSHPLTANMHMMNMNFPGQLA